MATVSKPTRKRNRKRKRRVVSDSSSSEDDSSSSSDASTPKKIETLPVQKPKTENRDTDQTDDEASSSSSSSSSSNESDSDDDVEVEASAPAPKSAPLAQRDSPSPPPNVEIPPFIQPNAPGCEQDLKEKFRKFWMTCIADGFKDDLEQIRKEPNLGPSRLALLIESLASGADVFSSNSKTGHGVNEMEVILDQLP